MRVAMIHRLMKAKNMNANSFNNGSPARSSAGEASSFGWVDAGDVVEFVSCLLEWAVDLLL